MERRAGCLPGTQRRPGGLSPTGARATQVGHCFRSDIWLTLPDRWEGKAASKEEVIQKTLQTIAQQRGKSVSQVALNWLLRRDTHVIPIPGTTSARHAMENADTLKWQLSDDEFAAIDQSLPPAQR